MCSLSWECSPEGDSKSQPLRKEVELYIHMYHFGLGPKEKKAEMLIPQKEGERKLEYYKARFIPN